MNSSGDSTQKVKTNQNIQVYVRVRPTNTREKLIRSNEVVEVHGARDVVAKQMLDSRTTKKFSFDRAFGMDSQQHEVYAAVVSPMIDEVLAGYNCTVFAYGQTGTGKTYTMVGEEQPTLTSTQEDASNVGIIPRALNHLFDELRLMEVEFAMRVSYLELYNEELCDLLSTDDTAKIRIYDDVAKKGSVIVQGLEEIPVRCKSDVYRLLAKGQERRRTAATLMNAQSSRSHTVFSILVHIKENGLDGEEMLKIGKLNLVDLAGSENISKAGNEKGIRTRESVNINQSLLTLGRVITALVERTPHIPYRESKLTRLLQESLGGRTKTSIIATVSPGHKDLEETLSTLDYAHRAKNIQNKPEINQRLTKKVVLKEYTEEIDRLKRDLMAAREKNGIYLATDTYNDMLYKMETQQKELNEKIQLFKSLKEELNDRTRMFDECQKNLEEISRDLIAEQGKLRITEVELTRTKRSLRKTERRYDETKVIVACQQETEQKLTEHAKQLIEVVEEASGDAHQLLESISRRKNVEESAVSATDLLLMNLSNNIIEMRHDMEQLQMKHKDSAKIVVADLAEHSKGSKQFVSAMLESVKELQSLRDDSGGRIRKILLEWTSETSGASMAERKKLLSVMREMEQQEATFSEVLNGKITNMELMLAKERSDDAALCAQLLEKIQQQNAAIEKFCDGLKEKISGHCASFRQLSMEIKSKQDAKNAKLQEIQKLLQEVTELSMESDQMHGEMDKLDADLETAEAMDVRAFGEKNSTIVVEKIVCLKSLENSHAVITGKLTEQLAAAADVVKHNNEKTKTSLEKQIEVVSSMEGELTARLSSLQVSVSAEVAEASKADEQKEEAMSDAIKSECSRALVKAQEVKSLVQQTLSGLVQTAQTRVGEKLMKSSNEIAKFHQDDVLKYKSSGETPVRKDFKFRKELVATSPHDRIIKRVRLARNLSESQMDGSIAESEAGDAQIINSTPLRAVQNVTDGDKTKDLKDLEISKVSVEEKENHATEEA